MKRSNTGRELALAGGVIATGGALLILLQDALATNVWHLEHGLIPALMVVQIITAHMVGAACRARRFGHALGFAFVALAGTWGVFQTSVGKQSAVAAEAVAVAEDVNARRDGALQRSALNQGMLDAARTRLATECGSGKGKRCAGVQATVAVYADAVAGASAELTRIGPPRPVSADADNMAELLGLMTGRDRAAIKHVLVLIKPFTFATIFEVAALVCFGFGFGHGRHPVFGNFPLKSESSIADTDRRQTSFPENDGALPASMFSGELRDPENDPPPPPRRKLKRLPANVIDFRARLPERHPVITAIETAGRPLSNRELAQAMGVSEGEASKRWQEIETLLSVGRHGKERRIGLVRLPQVSAAP